MEKRKSVSMTMMMQQKMQEVEAQLTQLRKQGGGGGGGTSAGGDARIKELERQLKEMSNQKVDCF